MGTTVQSIAGRATQSDGHQTAAGRTPFFNHRPGNWPQQASHAPEGPEPSFGGPTPNGPTGYAHGQTQAAPFDPNAPSQLRQSQPPNSSAPAPPGPPGPRNVHTPTPSAAAGAAAVGAAQLANQEKRGPVEFNHAISYVNKIKNRFQDKPEIYKQFLEILQTYQRESKAIADVYSQVTALFHTAPDLLEDFKQFLPESAGQKTTPGRAGEEAAAIAGAMHTPQPALGGPKMPPLGSFAPTERKQRD
ncbi:unnamed protein product [Parascedosporium putredinis]|uniref:PAH2 domain-containing protein n=1 Tax=Parascedosporium putredinis TaxID=1442378 RepID=A0A9P1H8J5_9PEZI|nr:unnamed protein product [Parascedosporium putredinis]CAI8002198.1 unnamed protein product [Parascedosporium putredinis]